MGNHDVCNWHTHNTLPQYYTQRWSHFNNMCNVISVDITLMCSHTPHCAWCIILLLWTHANTSRTTVSQVISHVCLCNSIHDMCVCCLCMETIHTICCTTLLQTIKQHVNTLGVATLQHHNTHVLTQHIITWRAVAISLEQLRVYNDNMSYVVNRHTHNNNSVYGSTYDCRIREINHVICTTHMPLHAVYLHKSHNARCTTNISLCMLHYATHTVQLAHHTYYYTFILTNRSSHN